MRKSSIIFLQTAVVLIGIGTLGLLFLAPRFEGRNANATNFEIYFQDPFLAYVYVGSLVFFAALVQAFKLLGFIGQNKVFSLVAVKALRNIKYCAIALGILIVLAAVYIRIFHAQDDDPAGFMALSIIATFISVVVATAAAVFEKQLQAAVDLKSENDLTV